MQAKQWFQRLLAGVILGIGLILPGISGGVLAVSMGLYEPMLRAIAHFFRDVRGNLGFLAPLVLGMALSILLVARALAWLMIAAQQPLILLLTGLILGSLPSLWKQAKGPEALGFTPATAARLAAFLLGIGCTLLLALLETPDKRLGLATLTGPQAFFSGAIYAFGTVVPGISSSFMLIYLGTYQALLEAVSTLNMPVLLCAGAGFGAMALLIIRLVERAFARFPAPAYSLVLGFVMGFTLLIARQLDFLARPGLHCLLLAAGLALAYAMDRGLGSKTLD